MSITAEEVVKEQKNGNTHRYVYYRCTKKGAKCSQRYVREEVLDQQLSDLLAAFAIPKEWADQLFALADKDEKEAVQNVETSA